MRPSVITAVVVALGIATAAAFTATEALKVRRPPVSSARFDQIVTPGCSCPTETARLSFRLRRKDTIDVDVVDSGGDTVRALASDSARPRGRLVFHWDGRSDSGTVVPPGVYQVRVHVDRGDRTIVIPKDIRVKQP